MKVKQKITLIFIYHLEGGKFQGSCLAIHLFVALK